MLVLRAADACQDDQINMVGSVLGGLLNGVIIMNDSVRFWVCTSSTNHEFAIVLSMDIDHVMAEIWKYDGLALSKISFEKYIFFLIICVLKKSRLSLSKIAFEKLH